MPARSALTRAVAAPAWASRFPRAYSAAAGLDKAQIQERVLGVLKGFEKVDPAKASLRMSTLSAIADCHAPAFRNFILHEGPWPRQP